MPPVLTFWLWLGSDPSPAGSDPAWEVWRGGLTYKDLGVAIKIKQGGYAGVGPFFHLPGQAILVPVFRATAIWAPPLLCGKQH